MPLVSLVGGLDCRRCVEAELEVVADALVARRVLESDRDQGGHLVPLLLQFSQLGCRNTADLVITTFAASPDFDQRVLLGQELYQVLPGFETVLDGIGFWTCRCHKGCKPVSLQLL